MFLAAIWSSLCFSSSLYRFIPPLVILTPHDSNEAVCRLLCVLYMPLFGLVQARPWFRSSNCISHFFISHLAFFNSHLSFLSRISHFFISHLAFFYLAFRIFISHLAFFILHLAFLCRIYLQKFLSSPTKSHLECPLLTGFRRAFFTIRQLTVQWLF